MIFKEYGILIITDPDIALLRSSTQIQIQREKCNNTKKNQISSLLPEFSRLRVISHVRLSTDSFRKIKT